jgi:uncharacterized protein HemX
LRASVHGKRQVLIAFRSGVAQLWIVDGSKHITHMKRYLYLILSLVALATALAYLTPARAQTSEELNSKAQKVNDQSRRLLDEQAERFKRVEALLTRQEQFMEKQEAAFKRFEKILDTWERQQQQYQKYLDTLPKK